MERRGTVAAPRAQAGLGNPQRQTHFCASHRPHGGLDPLLGHQPERRNPLLGASLLTPADAEKRQGFWWYLLMAGMALLVAEMVVANRLSRHERFT